ncbi:glycoside hydrolase family 140 protein [Tellurirhabdus rosea]|uniref:glycoside hydrolase family 140 protein n=1 Tax=Tellurirhabdus rosea TaxID=2674997 RepID=UPI0022528546|nr:glycoside hydrolase family 140 protein [Tellurirhabdus rosea]
MLARSAFFFAFLAITLSAAGQKTAPAALSKLYILKDKRYLMRGDQKPFFWLGDTAWELFHRLTREEADLYLKNRAAKGFTVIQAVALAEFDGLTQPNAYGQLPLKNNDPTQPVEAYFQHVDWVINRAGELGLVVGLLPTWGDKFNKKWGKGPEIFTPENARRYGEYLGRRYRNKPVIWILGGDRNPEGETRMTLIRAMAEGIRSGNGGTQLMTYHPMGDSNSAGFFHSDTWLNFNMFQSGHAARNKKNYVIQRQNYSLFPVKPTLDGEPRYEDHPVDWKPEQGYFDDFDVRQAAWWAMLSGGCGHTYGNHSIWQFFDVARNPPISAARTHWTRAMDSPGAFQMGYLRRLYESHPWTRLLPEQSVILNNNPDDGGHQVAALSEDDNFLFAYTPHGRPLTIDLSRLKAAPQLLAYWFNPRDGRTQRIGTFPNTGRQEFKPYAAGPGTDWVLVVDDAKAPWAGYGLKK